MERAQDYSTGEQCHRTAINPLQVHMGAGECHHEQRGWFVLKGILVVMQCKRCKSTASAGYLDECQEY